MAQELLLFQRVGYGNFIQFPSIEKDIFVSNNLSIENPIIVHPQGGFGGSLMTDIYCDLIEGELYEFSAVANMLFGDVSYYLRKDKMTGKQNVIGITNGNGDYIKPSEVISNDNKVTALFTPLVSGRYYLEFSMRSQTLFAEYYNIRLVKKQNSNLEQVNITSFTYQAQRMSATPTITASFYYPICLDNYWDMNVFAEFKGEKYYIRQIPSSSKDNKSVMYKHDITLYSERFVLENIYLYDVLKNDDTNVIIRCDLADFVKVINRSFEKSGLKYSVKIDDSVADTEKALEVKDIALDKVYLSVALQEIYNQWEISYYFEGYNIIVKDCSAHIYDNVLEYGYDKSLLSIKKENANFRKITRCSGYGSDKNIPFFYPNLSQKGVIDLEPLKSNELLLKSDFVITDMRKFDKQMPLNGTVTYHLENENKPIISGRYINGFKDLYLRVDIDKNIPFKLEVDRSGVFVECKFRLSTKEEFYIPYFDSLDWIFTDLNDYLPKQLAPKLKVIFSMTSSGGSTHIQDNPTINEIFSKITNQRSGNKLKYYIERTFTVNLSVFITESDKFTSKKNIYDCNIKLDLEDSDIVKNKTLLAEDGRGLTVTAHTASYKSYFSSNGLTDFHYKGETNFDTGWYLNKIKKINLSDIGVKYLKIENNTISGEGFKQVMVSKIPTATNLMPPLYRNTLGNEKFYNAKDNTYLNDDNEYYDFETEWTEVNQNEHIQPFEEIYPTITNIVNADNVPFDEVLDVAFDDNDNNEVDEEGNFLHPYFYVKIAQFNGSNGFNLFDHKIVGGNMQVSFTSGGGSACMFDIMVKTRPNMDNETYEDVINPVLTNGSGQIISGDWQQKTAGDFGSEDTTQQNSETNSIWLVLKKDDQTFGTTLPDSIGGVVPKKGDKFVLLNIEMPQKYIDSAEELLRKNIIQYMWENNSDKWNFSIDFSRIFLQENPIFVDDLSENAKVRVKYDGIIYDFYVNNYKYEVKSNEALPKITIGLVDTITINRSIAQAIASGIMQDVQRQLNGVAYLGDLNEQYLRKRYDETMPNNMTFEKNVNIKGNTVAEGGITSNYIASNNYNGQDIFNVGFKLENDENNESVLVVDRAIVRKRIEAFELVINQLKAQGGRLLVTSASMKCISVETYDTYYRCFLDTQTNNMYNQFDIDDLAICQVFGSSPKRYWRKVVNIGQDYIDLSIEDCEPNSDIPEVGDTIIQLGNATNIERQSAIELSSNGEKSPSFTMYSGINSFSLVDKEITGIDFEPDKYEEDENGNIVKVSDGYPNFFSYGSMYFGSRDKESNFISFQKNKDTGKFEMIINAKTTFKSGTQNISDVLSSIDSTANTANSNANNAQNTANQTKEELDNLAIGGENIVIGAYKYPNQDNAFVNTSDTDDDYYPYPGLYADLMEGQKYTLTAYTDGLWNNVQEITDNSLQVDCFLVLNYTIDNIIYPTNKRIHNVRMLNDGRLCSTFISPTTGKYHVRFDIDYKGNTRKFWQVQIEKGSVPSDWKPAETDTVKPLYDALKGSTEIEGGLINTNVLMVKDSKNAISGGVSGQSTDNIAFWSGGTLSDAINGNCNVIIRKDGTAKIGSFIISEDKAQIKLADGNYATMSANGIEVTLANGGKAIYNIDGISIVDNNNEEKIKLVDKMIEYEDFILESKEDSYDDIDSFLSLKAESAHAKSSANITSNGMPINFFVNNKHNTTVLKIYLTEFSFGKIYNNYSAGRRESFDVTINLTKSNSVLCLKRYAVRIDTSQDAQTLTYYSVADKKVTDVGSNGWGSGQKVNKGSIINLIKTEDLSIGIDQTIDIGDYSLDITITATSTGYASGYYTINPIGSIEYKIEEYSPKTLIGTNGMMNLLSTHKRFGSYLDKDNKYHIEGRADILDIKQV